MLSTGCKYAIRSVLYIALNASEEKKIGVKEVSEVLEVPFPFLAKLMQQLTKAKLISSTKGPKGGFYLNEQDQSRNVLDIINLMDGIDKFQGCFLGLSKCDPANPCPVHFTVAPFKEEIMGKFRDKSIMEFAAEIRLTGRHITLKDIV
mgnify:CR=1 FL=1